MRHRSSQTLFDHWQERRGNRLLPERSEIDPSVLRRALGDVFVLSYNPAGGHPFRLAGTRLCALMGRELKGRGFASLWPAEGHVTARSIAAAAADDSVGAVASAVGHAADGNEVDLELLLLPLRHYGQSHLRMIGVLAPLDTPFWLGAKPLVALSLTEHRFVGHQTGHSGPPLAVPFGRPPGRVRHGLVVYDGGQS